MKKASNKTNPRLSSLIATLKRASREHRAPIWKEIACRLESPSRNYAEVNVSKINRYAGDGETIIVPGKVLGSGVLDRQVKVAALNFSESARRKIRRVDGVCMTIEELLADNPTGSRVRILR
ncbi:MAG: 50S ribosomal protein L18e [Methanoculleaceae archaeon]